MGNLCLLADVKPLLDIELADTTYDTILNAMIAAASAFIEGECKRTFTQATYTDEHHEGDGDRVVMLEHFPVKSVTSVSVDGDTVTSTDYRVDDIGVTLTLDSGTRFNEGTDILVTYVAGYGAPGTATTPAMPSDLVMACAELAASKFRDRPRAGVLSESMAGQSLSFSPWAVPAFTHQVISLYKRRD